MNSALLRFPIEIYGLRTVMTDYGEVKEFHDVLKYKTRAFMKFNNETVATTEGEVVYTTDRLFIVRHYVNVDERDEIQFEGKRYRIISINRNIYYNNIEIYTTEKNT